MARALPKRKRNPRVEVTLQKGGLTRELMLMAPRDQYAVLSAVRGPDVNADYNQLKLKNTVTERLRSIAFSYDVEFPGNYDNTPMDKPDFDLAMKHIDAIRRGGQPAGAWHYLDHLKIALHATWAHKVWGKYGLDLHRALAKVAD